MAAVARSYSAAFLGASTVTYPGRVDAESLEALACREALALASDLHVRHIRVASDCKNVITSLEEGTMGVYAHIIREIHSALPCDMSYGTCSALEAYLRQVRRAASGQA